MLAKMTYFCSNPPHYYNDNRGKIRPLCFLILRQDGPLYSRGSLLSSAYF